MTSKKDISDAARLLSQLGASKGGQARANGLTPKRRTEIARNAARVRWSQAKRKGKEA